MNECFASTSASSFARAKFSCTDGCQQATAIIDVRAPETVSARREMVNLLRALAFDIEAGAA